MLVVIALFADGECEGKAVAGRRERAGGVRSVRARGIFQTIEIEGELAGLVEAIRGEAGIEKAARAVSGRGAGGVTEDEEKFGHGGIFDDRFEAECFSSESKFGRAGNGLIVIGADERGQSDGLGRNVRNPLGGDAIGAVGCVPLEAVEADYGR